MFYLIYKITNLLNYKTYIGMHQTENICDNYMGSGKLIKRAIKKYGVENFQKEILFIFDNELDMIQKEADLVSEEFCLRTDTYNITNGGLGGWSYVNRSNLPKFHNRHHLQETKETISLKRIGKPTTLGHKHTEESKKIIGEKSKNFNTGKSKTSETKNKISASMQKRMANPDNLEKLQNSMANARLHKPEFTSPSTKEKISNSVKKSWQNRERPIRDWEAIQKDLDADLSRKDIYQKHNISKTILDHGLRKGYISSK